jgi:hypothetical protein
MRSINHSSNEYHSFRWVWDLGELMLIQSLLFKLVQVSCSTLHAYPPTTNLVPTGHRVGLWLKCSLGLVICRVVCLQETRQLKDN